MSALEILESEGPDAMSLRGVARKAGVSQAAPYHHFKDKRSLFAAIATIGHLRLAETARSFRDRGGKGFASLIRMGAGYVAFAKDNTNLFRLMFGPELADFSDDQDYEDAAHLGQIMIRERMVVIMGVDIEDGKSDLERAALAAWCFVHGLAMLIVDNKVPCPDTNEPEYLDFIFSMFASTNSLIWPVSQKPAA